MKTAILISSLAVLLLQTSCMEELTYHPFESSQNGFSRYLTEISETSYYTNNDGATVLFGNPIYDSNGRVTSVYNNIVGSDANYTYQYTDNAIEITVMCQSGKVIHWNYVVKDGVIVSCVESSTASDAIKTYKFSYDLSNTLVNITVDDGEYDSHFNVAITWDYDNISSVEKVTSSSSEVYEFEYNDKNNRYNGEMPFFFSSCYFLGGVYGVDEILSIEGYFGTSISRYIPTTVYYNGKVTREFEYSIDNDGYVSAVKEFSSETKKTYRIYSFKWS